MTKMTFIARTAMAAVLASSGLLAQAAPTVYASQATFAAATANAAVDSFDSLDPGAGDQITRSAGSYGYTATAAGGFFAVGPAGDGWLSTNIALPIVFDGFTGGVNAVGGFFFASDVDGHELAGETLTVTVTDGSGSTTRTLVNPGTSSFIGFVSDSKILALQVGIVDTGSNNAWATVNDLMLGGPVAAVPEPTTLALSLAGLMFLVTRVARRRQW